jgi:DMSO/TMAO reductase YedYZ molybdopterin-dependent catalytic subunit
VSSSTKRDGWRRFAIGLNAALAFVVVQLLARLVAGVPSVVEVVQDQLVLLLPGPVFSFVLDRLLYLGKPLFFAGLLIGLVLVLGALGAVALRLHEAILFAAVLWVLGGLAELIATGNGFFAGRADLALSGLIACAAYGAILIVESTRDPQVVPASVERVDTTAPSAGGSLWDRRELLSGGALFVVAAVLARQVIGNLPSLPGRSTATAGPSTTGGQAGSPIPGLPPRVTPVADFYVVSKNLVDPVVDQKGWTLTVTGTVDHPLTFTYDQLRALPSVQVERTLECISNDVGGDLLSNGVWTGVRLADLARLVSPLPLTSLLRFSCTDGYTESMPLDRALNPSAILAYDLDGAPLPPKHGFPARILGFGTYGMKNPKWVTEIQFARSTAPGFWEQQGWNPDAIVQTMARIDTPTDGSSVKSSQLTVAGVAFAGDRGIKSVELSSDGGMTWQPATLLPPVIPNVWTFWRADWTPGRLGATTLVVRAVDGTGQPQTGASADTFPVGATGYHQVRVNVAG